VRIGNDKHLNIMDDLNVDLLLKRYEAWSCIPYSAKLRIKSTELGNFNILQQLVYCWKYLCGTYCLQFNPCDIAAVKANLVLKATLKSWNTIQIVTPWSCFLMCQMEYMGQALLAFCFSPTRPLDRYIQEVALSVLVSVKTAGGILCLFLCQHLK
jgi:hypothetical protein